MATFYGSSFIDTSKDLFKRWRWFNRVPKETIVRYQHMDASRNTPITQNEALEDKVRQLNLRQAAMQLQHQKTAEALKDVNDLYDYSPCGYHSTDIDGTFIRINATELSWLGYEVDELIGKKRFIDLLSPASRAALPDIFTEFKAGGVLKETEFEMIRKDGSLLPVLINATATYSADNLFLMSRSVVFDLTDRKKMEQQIRLTNEKIIEILAEKNNFLAIASHDLKSPLNSILGLLNLLKADSANMTSDQQENVALIFNAGKNMKAMIDKLLDLNRIEQGKSLVQKSGIDLVVVVQKVIAGIAIMAAKKQIQITLVTDTPQMAIISDPAIISQVCENLISNALKFSNAGKNTCVALGWAGENVKIEVHDEGPGIKPEEAHRVFGKFQKLSARPTAGESSTGLGLSIVRELVATLDGTVTFESVPGVRTVFSVRLPAK